MWKAKLWAEGRGKKLIKRSEDKAKRCEAMRSDAKRLSACGEGRLFKKALPK